MSLVNLAGSVSKISPHHSFFRKNFNVRSWAGLVAEILVKILTYEHFSTGNQDKIASPSQHSSQNGIIFLSFQDFDFDVSL